MRVSRWTTTALAAALLAGCAGSSVPIEEQVSTVGPHRGPTLQLPEKKGFVELVNEPAPRDRRGGEPTALVAYFLKLDGRSPMEPAPTDVRFTIDAGARANGRGGHARGKAQAASGVVELLPEPKAEDPAGASRFASRLGPYQLDAVRGSLSARVDGQETGVTFQGGR